ncbi:MAG: YpsA SLOG family protein [Streptosporangiaceae bacterium]
MLARPAGTGRADEAALRHVVRAAPGLTVLTGGQTGVDTIAVHAALGAGLPVHVVFPLGLRQEDGSLTPARRRRLAGAIAHELGSASFRHRTWTCVDVADAVLLQPAAGAASADHVARWLAEAAARVVMVAGCRASVLARQAGADRGVRADMTEVIAGAADWHGRLLRGGN